MINPFFAYFENSRNLSDKHLFYDKLPVVKQYSNAKQVQLPEAREVATSFSEQIKSRQSNRDFKNTKLTMEDLSQVLYWSLSPQAIPQPDDLSFTRRPHPSGGAKFPIETYLLTDTHDSLGSAIYHYRGDEHVLEHLQDMSPEEIKQIQESYLYDFVSDIPVLCIFTYIQERNVPKYGSYGSKLALLEAGHIAQNMYLVAAAQNTKVIALAGGDYNLLNSSLALDGYNECGFYTVGLGSTSE